MIEISPTVWKKMSFKDSPKTINVKLLPHPSPSWANIER